MLAAVIWCVRIELCNNLVCHRGEGRHQLGLHHRDCAKPSDTVTEQRRVEGGGRKREEEGRGRRKEEEEGGERREEEGGGGRREEEGGGGRRRGRRQE